MNGIESLLLPGFILVFLVWVGLSAYTILNRAIYEVRHSAVRKAQGMLQDPRLQALHPEERARQVEQILEHLPRGTIDRVAADSSVPQWAAEAFSAYALRKWGIGRLVQDASAHRGEFDMWRRIAALRILSHAGYPDILSLLEKALNDGDRDVVGAAVTLLGRMPDLRAARLLIMALRTQVYPPSRIATLLDRFPLEIPHLLRPLLQDPLPLVRFWAATLLARYAGTAHLDTDLAELAADPDPLVRKAAIETLGKVDGPRADSSARKLLNDPVWYVKAHAARALGDLRRADSAEQVMPLLADSEWWVRFAAKESLQAIGPTIVPDLVAYLDHPDGFARNGAAEVLQNLGFLDSLVTEIVKDSALDQTKTTLLRKVISAGGMGLAEALLGRLDLNDLPAVHRLLKSLGFEPMRNS